MAETKREFIARARHLLEHDTEAALRLLSEVVARQPDFAEAHGLLFDTHLRRADFPGAEAVAAAALKRWPNAPGWLTQRSVVLAYSGRLEQACEDLEAALARAPSRYRALRLGALRHALGAPERAVPLFRRALALGAADGEGERAQVWALLLRALRDLGRGAESDDAARACIALYRKRPNWIASTVERITNQCDHWELDHLRKKDGLARALAASPPDAAPRHPASYVLPEAAERLAADAAAGASGPVWIVKPNDLFGGQGIHLVDDPAAIPADRPQLVQHYVDRPLLVGGRKQHLRCYLMITEADPLRAWFWRDGLVRFAPAPFERGPGWLARADMHITNTALHQGHPGIRFNPDPAVEDDGSVWGLAAFVDKIAAGAAEREALWRRLEELARRLAGVLARTGLFERQRGAGRAYRPKLLGLDVLLDAELQPWLIEIQRDPGQTGDGPVNTVNGRLFRTMFEMTIAPVGSDDPAAIRAAERAAEMRARGAFVLL
jgi:tetratricopeptide (TPR) repeat protein